MRPTLRRPRGFRLPITLSVSLMLVNVLLMVCWIVLLAQHQQWSMLTIGTALFSLILAGLGLYLYVTLKEIALNRRQANFVDSVTHELKSPLASLKLYLETLQLRSLSETQRAEFLGFMHRDVDRLERMIEHLLEVGRLESLVAEGAAEDVSLEPLLRECAERACELNHQPAGAVALDVPSLSAHGGRTALEMIFRNLLDNAFKYGGETPKVEIEARPLRGNRVVVRVSDNGPGVPHDLRNKIFGLFFRGGHEMKRTTKGTGLGLYIVHTLVAKLKGRVAVFDRGREPGAVFEVVLPGKADP
ncbi:MAG TPA: HAMP domain-containing sensor histidine kinase [Planctomycetia bacterium]|nr:HAMP domain-containing sensor histidine kinase [Planctomycetia bacterium]